MCSTGFKIKYKRCREIVDMNVILFVRETLKDWGFGENRWQVAQEDPMSFGILFASEFAFCGLDRLIR